jgi:methylmalonyl-CoA/ethylmalonyl-CoA epimerase
MRRFGIFVAGVLVGVSLRSVTAQKNPVISLNHVAIAVADFDSATRFYRDVMGLPEAFSFRDASGPVLSYFQVNRNTFIELMPITPQRPAGLVHYGVEVADIDAEVSRLRAGGVKVEGPMVSPRTKARGANATMPDGTRVEFFEYGPESLQRKAMDGWKDR